MQFTILNMYVLLMQMRMNATVTLAPRNASIRLVHTTASAGLATYCNRMAISVEVSL